MLEYKGQEGTSKNSLMFLKKIYLKVGGVTLSRKITDPEKGLQMLVMDSVVSRHQKEVHAAECCCFTKIK